MVVSHHFLSVILRKSAESVHTPLCIHCHPLCHIGNVASKYFHCCTCYLHGKTFDLLVIRRVKFTSTHAANKLDCLFCFQPSFFFFSIHVRWCKEPQQTACKVKYDSSHGFGRKSPASWIAAASTL